MAQEAPFSPPFTYRPEVLAALLDLGVRPTAATPPPLLRAYVNDLYRWELRRLRDRLLAGDFPRHAYAGRVIVLRSRYFLLSRPLESWLAGPRTRPEPGRDA